MADWEIVLYRPSRPEGFPLGPEELAAAAGVHPTLVCRLAELGLLEYRGSPEEPLFALVSIPQLRRMLRLRRDLGINWVGIGLVMDLLDEIGALRREIARLRGGLKS